MRFRDGAHIPFLVVSPLPAHSCRRSSTSFAMARLRATVPLRRRYSLDLRRRVIYQKHTLNRKTKQIARDLDIPLRVVQRILKMWADLDDLVEPSHRHKTPQLKPEHLEVRPACRP
jgi:hypothetical protein